ncbi:MAG: hypothetical protein SFT93_01865 [Rickettsiaceae bacterium]|nr:hypothetical protein [Rickettsiaceae bacterium]
MLKKTFYNQVLCILLMFTFFNAKATSSSFAGASDYKTLGLLYQYYGYTLVTKADAKIIMNNSELMSLNVGDIAHSSAALRMQKITCKKPEKCHEHNFEVWIRGNALRGEQNHSFEKDSDYSIDLYGKTIGIDGYLSETLLTGISFSRVGGNTTDTSLNNYSNSTTVYLPNNSFSSRPYTIYLAYDTGTDIFWKNIFSLSESILQKKSIVTGTIDGYSKSTLHKSIANTLSKNFETTLEYKHLINKDENCYIVPFAGAKLAQFKNSLDISYTDEYKDLEGYSYDIVKPVYKSVLSGLVGSKLVLSRKISNDMYFIPTISLAGGKKLLKQDSRANGFDLANLKKYGKKGYFMNFGVDAALDNSYLKIQADYKLYAREKYIAHQAGLAAILNF